MLVRGLLALLLVSSIGCKKEDPDAIGSFALEGTRTASCGDVGLLASPEVLQDTVYLRKASQRTLQWEDKTGLMLLDLGENNNEFSAQRTLIVDMRVGPQEPQEPQEPVDPNVIPLDPTAPPPCKIQRLDQINGVLDGDENGNYTSFEVTLRYDFEPTTGSVCTDSFTPEFLPMGVPCAIAYDASGEKNGETAAEETE